MMGSPRLRLLIAAVLSLLGLTLIVIPVEPAVSAEAPATQDASVELLAFQARPDRLEITTGTTVTWINKELIDYPLMSGTHEIKAEDGSFASPALAPGTRWSHRFNLPGEFTYRCADHHDLVGTIVVTGPPILEKVLEEVGITEPKPDDPTTWGFRPNDLVVTTGMSVEWRNNGTNTHTVTSDDGRFESGEITPGSTWKLEFDEAGTFVYHCTPHPWMTASVRVIVPGGAPPPPPPPATPPAPVATRAPHARDATAGDGRRGPVSHEVDIVEPNPANPNSYTFDPPSLDLLAGDTVVWRNTGRMQHSVTALDAMFDSGLLAPGATWSRTFSAAAFVDYRCTPHPWMRGVLRVADLTGPPPTPPVSRTAAGVSVALTSPQSPERRGGGPVKHDVSIVEPSPTDAMAWGFNPKVVEAVAGDTVEWRNTGTLQHSVTAEGFDAGLIDPGSTFAKTFDAPGVYAYRCTPHPWMQGVVRVVASAGGVAPPLPSLDTAAAGTALAAASGPATAPVHLLARAARHGTGLVALGWLLLGAAVAVGFTLLLSWAWETPVGA